MTYVEIGQILTGITALFLLGLAGYGVANLRYKVPGTGVFVALTIAGAIWCSGYVLELGQEVAEGFMTAIRVEYLGLAFVPPLWCLVTLSWMEYPLARAKWLQTTLLAVGVALVLLVWTNPFHNLWYTAIVPTGKTGLCRFEPGPAHPFVITAYIVAFGLSSLLLLLRRRHVEAFRRKARILVLTSLFPVSFAIAYQLGIRPWGLDPSVISLLPAFSTLAWGLFRHDFVRILPIARETVMECMDEAVLVFDTKGALVDHNAAAKPLLGPLQEALSANQAPRGELPLTLPQGGERVYRYRRYPIQGQGHALRGTAVLLVDVTEERRLLDQLVHQASHDGLTGVANRRHFEERATAEITRAQRNGGTMGLVLFDLDHFKTVNERYGFSGGDRILRSVAKAVNPKLRTYDLLGRMGEEEFAVLMPDASPSEAREAAERLRVAIESFPHILPENIALVTASFGVSSLNDLPANFPKDPQARLEILLALADKGVRQAKAEGRNRVC